MRANTSFSNVPRTVTIFFALVVLIGAVASVGVARAPALVVAESAPVELSPEWTMKRKAVTFDHMFRESAPVRGRSDWIRSSRRD